MEILIGAEVETRRNELGINVILIRPLQDN
jgi:hypothetical protein